MDSLMQLDRELFTWVNSTAALPPLDWFFKALRHAATWIPLYAFIVYWVIRYHRRQAWPFILLCLVCFTITDYVSASIMKPLFARPRPCYDPLLQASLRDLVGCGGKFGLPSSHASNHFGLAAFWYFSINWMSNRRWAWLWVWAFAICYAQVYVGKHYPGDILLGAVFGTLTGLLGALAFRRWRLSGRLAAASVKPL